MDYMFIWFLSMLALGSMALVWVVKRYDLENSKSVVRYLPAIGFFLFVCVLAAVLVLTRD